MMNSSRGEFYWADSHKNNTCTRYPNGYSVGEWISVGLYKKLSDKELDTKNIGKMSFTSKGGNDAEDRKKCYDFMDKLVKCLNKDGHI